MQSTPAQILFLLFLTALACGTAHAQTCTYGEAPTDNCPGTGPRVVDGSVGQHVVLMDATNATGTPTYCGISVDHTVWFEVTPVVSGPMTISTCHPQTSYDTVLQVWSGGDPDCFSMIPEDCNDDTPTTECNNGCSFSGSTVTVNATAGMRYRFAVGSVAATSQTCSQCLGVIVTIGNPCGDAPTNLDCNLAKPLPGQPGIHQDFVDTTDAFLLMSEPQPFCTTFAPGHTVWYHVQPTVTGPLTFSSCLPETQYDTVIQAYTGSCTGIMTPVDCNDDTLLPECTNNCGPVRGSGVAFTAFAGQDYYFQVGSFDNNMAGCELCLGVEMEIQDICVLDTTAPIATITAPAEQACGCDSIDIIGTADDPDGVFLNYRVDYRAMGASSWNSINFSSTPVTGGTLATWNTVGLSEGWYLVRVIAENVCNVSSTAVRLIRLDKRFDSLLLRAPGPSAILGGTVCVDGTAWDQCFKEYTVKQRPAGGGSFTPIDPLQVTYTNSVITDALGEWNTTIGIPDGNFDLQLMGASLCGKTDSRSATVTIDNTPPVAAIASPTNCEFLANGMVQIIGTAIDANLNSWVLQYTGGNSNGWTTIATNTTNVNNGVLGIWDTSNLPRCAYTLRLIVTDNATLNCNGAIRHRSEFAVSVQVGTFHDFDADNDGDVDLNDYYFFAQEFMGPNLP